MLFFIRDVYDNANKWRTMKFPRRRKCFAYITKLLIATIVAVSCASLLNFLCITGVCEVSEVSNPAWSDFGDVVVEANKVSSSINENRSIARFSFVSNPQSEVETDPKKKKLDVAQKLKSLHLTSLDFCPKEEELASSLTLLAGRRENSPTKRFLAVGVPSITRKSASYLTKTLTSIFNAVHRDEEKNVTIVTFLADSSDDAKQKQLKDLSGLFKEYIKRGTLQIIQAPVDYYEPLRNLHHSLGDNMGRVLWRSKQALDYSFLMCYCSYISQYYLQLEDDVFASPSFVSKLIDFVNSRKGGDWISLNVALLGYIGKLYHHSELQNLASYIYLFFNDMPVDWLEPRWKAYRGQDPYLTEPRAASLFQHFGLYSSFRPKETQRLNTLEEKFFDQFDHKYKGLNPPAEISSNLVSRSGQPSDAYKRGDGYFWGRCGSAGTKVYNILLKESADIKRITVATGANFAQRDFIIKGTLEVSRSTDASNTEGCAKFIIIGHFRLGQVDVTRHLGHIKCIRIRVPYQSRWILLREVNVWT